ncbi:flagellin N-terminal helical domain-containing protein [Aliarcobacter cryaerophilus]|uniref:Flagellin n=2 Tax=unclassified Arcobacter TaxID=2593671 RepID=A0AA96HZC8_9BACT|nr:flagellin [Arcobacter sp. AZ-2023]WPD09130.1 flagellin [Arcobacter sp. DSM 115954]WNL13962.1 flagellin [Arcobacter sp. AZ-2023]WNL20157.1 flagellin [Arcobacter sp. AZ-2023]WNL22299.1 flagellin [Arcobacter sp. AZ-2023]
MVINTNVSSLRAQEASTNTNNAISSSLEKLSTGLKINKASDDASGLAIADKLRTQVTSIKQGIANGNSAISLITIADKAMDEQSKILDTIKGKLINANSSSTSADGREAIRKDIGKLLEQLDNIAAMTNYNGMSLLADVKDGKLTGKESSELTFQVGERNTDMISTTKINATTSSLGGGSSSVDKIESGETAKLSNVAGGTLDIQNKSGGTLNVAVSGNLGKLTAEGGDLVITVDPNDATLIAKLKDLVSGTDFTQGTGADKNKFTLDTGKTVDLRAIDFDSVQLRSDTTGHGFSAKETTGFEVKNLELGGNTDNLTVTSKQDLKKGESTTVSNSDASQKLTVATSSAAMNMKVSGNLGSVTTATIALSIEGTNSKDVAALQKLVDDGVADITRDATNANKFTIAAGKTVDLSSVNLSDAKITSTAANGNFTSTATDKLVIANNSEDKIVLSNIDAKSASKLDALKNLQTGELTTKVASDYQAVVNDAISQLNGYRSDMGSTENQVKSAVKNLMTSATNIKAAESIIREVDFAEESANFNKLNILSQAGSYAISQSNAAQQNVLRLLQ